MMLYTCNASIWDAEAEKFRVQDPHGLLIKISYLKKKRKRNVLSWQ